MKLLQSMVRGVPQFNRSFWTSAITFACMAAPAFAATPPSDLAFEVQQSNGDKASGWVIEKLVTLKVGDKCWPKLLDKKRGMVGRIAGYARHIEKYARVISGDELEWSTIENRSRGAEEQTKANRAIVEKKIDDFKSKFHLTVFNEGDDCEASGSGLWFKYANEVLQSLKRFPPKSGKAFVTVNATSTAKTVTIEIAADGSTITVTGPRDVEPSGWGDGRIDNALKRVSSKG